MTISPTSRADQTQVDASMKGSLWLAGILLTTTCVLTYALLLNAEAFQDQSLAVLNAFLAYPIVAYSAFSVYQVLYRGSDSASACMTSNW